MNKPLVIRKVGNRDRVFAVRTPRGYELTPYSAEFEKAVNLARDFSRKYPHAMKKLAE